MSARSSTLAVLTALALCSRPGEAAAPRGDEVRASLRAALEARAPPPPPPPATLPRLPRKTELSPSRNAATRAARTAAVVRRYATQVASDAQVRGSAGRTAAVFSPRANDEGEASSASSGGRAQAGAAAARAEADDSGSSSNAAKKNGNGNNGNNGNGNGNGGNGNGKGNGNKH